MPKKRIEKLLAEAGEYLNQNPETPLSLFEIAALSLLGADVSRGRDLDISEPPQIDEFRAAAETFTEPYTAEDLAAIVFGKFMQDGRPNRLQLRAAGRAARMITGRSPRKSNGRSLYDPIK